MSESCFVIRRAASAPRPRAAEQGEGKTGWGNLRTGAQATVISESAMSLFLTQERFGL